MNERKITLKRKTNIALGGRKFKIIVDGQEVNEIANAETKTIELPLEAKELKIKVMNYESNVYDVSSENETFLEIKQNVISTASSLIFALLICIFFVFKFMLDQDKPVVLFFALPCVATSIYFSTFGRKKVIQIKKIEEI